jgi:hypothetical protein
MADIVELCARPDVRRGESRAIDGTVATDFHFVTDFHGAELGNLSGPSRGVLRVAKSIGANGGVRVDFAGIANLTGCTDKNVWMQDRGGPDPRVVLDYGMRADETAIANRHSGANHAIRAKDHVLTERGTRMHQ